MYITENLEPKRVFKHFEDIARIPHGSGNEKAVSDHILAYAKGLGLDAVQDSANNLVIRMKASQGYENAPVVILQGHMDMVCEKNNETEFDFTKDGLKLNIDGDFLKAEGTTLGADNGIAVAYAMALMELDFKHPAIEFVITTDEEVGMGGAEAIDPALINGRIFINLDSEEEGIFLTSCAGGVKIDLDLTGELGAAPDGFTPVEIKVYGLKGGHSGMDIDKERGNANCLLGRTLYTVFEKHETVLAFITGGSKDNAIPREASVVVYVKETEKAAVFEAAEEAGKAYRYEYETSDPGLKLEVSECKHTGSVFTGDMLTRVMRALMLLPCGVSSMSMNIPGLVETSNNVGVISTKNNSIRIQCAVRSSVASKKRLLVQKIKCVAGIVGAQFGARGDYPGWEYDRNSKIRPMITGLYKEMYGKEPVINAIHAGLECGVFADKLKGLDCISLGPDMFDVHTPDERVSISSVERVWDFMLKLLERMK